MRADSDARVRPGSSRSAGLVYQDRNGVVSHVERPSRGDGADNLEIEMMRAREMHKSLRKKELLEGKLARVPPLSKAKRALARKTMKKMEETAEFERSVRQGRPSPAATNVGSKGMDSPAKLSRRERWTTIVGNLIWRTTHLMSCCTLASVPWLAFKTPFRNRKDRSSKF